MQENLLLSKEDIEEINSRLAKEINEEFKGEELIVVALLKGGVMFCTDLIKELDIQVYLDFLTASSYKNSEQSSGNVEILSDVRVDIKDKNVLIVDDIFDTGYTMESIYKYFEIKEPKKLKTCVLLDKPSRRKVDFQVDFIGKEIDDLFVVGYGLDYEGFYRNTPYIFTFS